MRPEPRPNTGFPPSTPQELKRTRWGRPDIVLVTGDAYVDHPSFGAAMIARALEAAGFRVAVLPQPDWRSAAEFRSLGRPRLFLAITAGNVDSMVANYTAYRNRRKEDAYSPGGRAGMRPNRASLVYAHRAREAFPGTPIVLGGVEAGMRRLSHYDFWEGRVRRSVLLDAKADLLLYGMAEGTVVEVARILAGGRGIEAARSLRGVVYAVSEGSADIDSAAPDVVRLPAYREVAEDPRAFTRSFRIRHLAADPFSGTTLVEPTGDRMVVQTPPPIPLTQESLDGLYELPFTGAAHPRYGGEAVPALETVKTSLVTHRGCFGGCAFCGIGFHQGRIIQSRSIASLVREAGTLAGRAGFKGTINDVGGPSANMYGFTCKSGAAREACRRPHCLIPSRCPHLKEGQQLGTELLRSLCEVPGVSHVFVQSGIRHDLTFTKAGQAYLKALVARHISGRLKVAPEHSEAAVLEVMRKPPFACYEEFRRIFDGLNREAGKRQFLTSYFITAHPGCGMEEMMALKKKLDRLGLKPEQVQDYTPLPGTAASVMFHTGLDPFTDRPVFVARTDRERRAQRRVIQPPEPPPSRNQA